MFADLVGSTAIGERLDPEDMRDVIAAYHTCVSSLVARLDGFVAKHMGDGVLIYFGYPQAHEDDAERAVRTGLAIVKAVGELKTAAGPAGALNTRVGIATGLVVVGDLIGSGSSLESPAVGGTPNLAARLQALAKPGMVVIADDTRRLIGKLFEYDELGPVQLKGFDIPVRAWAVLAESASDNRFEALRPHLVRLIDRHEEMELLLRRWDSAKAGQGRVVLLSAEPGMGKSRLVAELERRVSDLPRNRLHLVCSPHYDDTPLYPLIRLFERGAGLRRGDAPAIKRAKLDRALVVPLSAVEMALLSELLSIPATDQALCNAFPPQRKREMIFSIILRQLEGLAAERPTLTVVEDIHWADPTSVDLVTTLIDAVAGWSMLLVVTTRPEVQPPWIARPHVTVQVLSGLQGKDAAALIGEVTVSRVLPKDVVDRIIARADGVPLFIEELTETVLEQGSPKGKAETDFVPLSPDIVPMSLNASLMARLDRLAGGKEVAQIGSVIGREFQFEMLRAVSSLPQKELEGALGELVRSGLVIPRGRPPDAKYVFKHALVQDAAYASMLREQRRKMHLNVAQALEEIRGSEVFEPQVLAWHFAEGGAAEKSIDYYLKAAELTTGRFALAEMVSYFQQALLQLSALPDSPERQRRELALQISLGRVLIDHEGSGSERVRTVFERARELCLALGETQQLLRVHDGLMNYHFTHSEPITVLRYADEILELGQKTGSTQAFLMAYRSAGPANMLLGRFVQARRELELVIEMYDVERDGPHTGLTTRDPKISAGNILGLCLTALGCPESGARASLETIRHAEVLGHAVSLILAIRRACVQGIMERHAARVLELSNRLLAMNAEYHTFLGLREGTIFQSWARLRTGKDVAALDHMQRSIEQLVEAKHSVMLAFFMASAAEVRGDHGDIEGAVGLLDQAAELIKLTGEQWCEAEVIRLQARFARDRERAGNLLQVGLALARQQGAKLWELRIAMALAALARDGGEHATARQVLETTYAGFTEGFDTHDLIGARTLLQELGAALPSGGPPEAV